MISSWLVFWPHYQGQGGDRTTRIFAVMAKVARLDTDGHPPYAFVQPLPSHEGQGTFAAAPPDDLGKFDLWPTYAASFEFLRSVFDQSKCSFAATAA
ncbi:MAG: hypothetical protein Q7K20_15790 [Polaromonas sp.]|jgi:hypothetical protein|nr:hypothetical protein [Polaromonas sp.]